MMAIADRFNGIRRVLAGLGAASIPALAILFLLDDALPYLEFSEASYGRFWDRSVWLLVHVFGGSLALLAGLLQHWSGFRQRHGEVHPWIGYVYVAGIALAAGTAFQLSFHTQDWTFGVALFTGALVWLAATCLAVVEAIRGRFDTHREWMLRSYILTFSFVSFRLVLEIPWVEQLGTEAEVSTTFGWLCWVLPLCTYEFLRQLRQDQLSGRHIQSGLFSPDAAAPRS
jgi:uncharacterized membrane protein